MRRSRQITVEHVGLRHSLYDPAEGDDLAYADEFAACLLMPELAVRDFCRRHEHASAGGLAIICGSHFRVPAEAARHRLRRLGIV